MENHARMTYVVTTFYKFLPISEGDLVQHKAELEALADRTALHGLMLLAPEGVNATVAGSDSAVSEVKAWLEGVYGDMTFKDSASETQPFKRFKVSKRDEIVQLRRTDIQPGGQSHISPEEWDGLIEDDDAVVIDVRNWYETKLGSFTGAIDPDTEKFSEFPDWVAESGIPKDARVGIFCTGGIRCEKAAVAMEEQGYENVHQLDGGILNYIAKRPNKNYEGECFVFDHRMSVDQELQPSTKYGRCPHCGNAGDISEHCARCESNFKSCADCKKAQPQPACSKRCRNELQRELAKQGQ